ncbi:MAG: TetR family transcriptional regulator C-terminal domain-containing protein [Gammaproteobacteria bacterium]|nr:TetR family transcriptional regulator C-terminal domain-containing protein [Gammaproteobacteria bacterium]NVK89363.1 TetR family transcriptional regulator C-terminal domain-containing protein [Gammaproteobacteria bacterium]
MVSRNPDQTRKKILEAALEEIHLRGFQGMRVEHILQRTGLTKGALYHHFTNKMAIGYAIVDEILGQDVMERWIGPLADTVDPIATLIAICEGERAGRTIDEIEKGCPINNLSQEMSPIDEGFRERLEAVYARWTEAIATALAAGQQQGYVREDIDPAKVARFLLASLQGIIGVAKCCKNEQALDDMAECFRGYLMQLRPMESSLKTAS